MRLDVMLLLGLCSACNCGGVAVVERPAVPQEEEDAGVVVIEPGCEACGRADCAGLACTCLEGGCTPDAWSSCAATGSAACAGSQTRRAPQCVAVGRCELADEVRACPRSGDACGGAGMAGPCTPSSAQSCLGSRSIGAGVCEAGACTGSAVTTEACAVPAGTACGTASAWSACLGDGGTDCMGSQARTVKRCLDDGGCGSALETRGCALADGTFCGAAVSTGACAQANPLACNGTRSVTRPACSAGACTGSRVEQQACSVAAGTSCGSSVCCGQGVAEYARCPVVAGGKRGCGSEFYDGTCLANGTCNRLCNRVVCWNGVGNGECGMGGEDTRVNLACPL